MSYTAKDHVFHCPCLKECEAELDEYKVRIHALEAQLLTATLALRAIRNHEDHDKYCDGCRCTRAIAEGALDEIG